MSSIEGGEDRSGAGNDSSETMGIITRSLLDLRVGAKSDVAYNAIVDRYFGEMAARTDPKFRGSTAPADGQDVAIELFLELRGLFAARRKWVFSTAVDREGLLVVMKRLAACHASKMLARERRPIRGGGQVNRESDLQEGGIDSTVYDAPSDRALMKEEIREIEKTIRERSASSRTVGLGNRRVAIFHAWRAGRDAKEIAPMISRSVRMAQREIEEILRILFEEFGYIPPSRERGDKPDPL